MGDHTVFLVQFGINLHEWVFSSSWKNSRGGSAERPFLKPFFFHSRKFFSKFPHKIFAIILRHNIDLANFLLSFTSANHNPELRCVKFALVLHFLHWCYTWTALLSANQNRVIFSCIFIIIKKKSQPKCVKLRQKLFVVPQELVCH